MLGRITGYEENKHIIIYTNIETVLKYQELWNSSFKNNKIIWNSETTKYINGEIESTKTFNLMLKGLGYENYEKEKRPRLNISVIIEKFKTQNEAIEFAKSINHNIKPYIKNKDGFYYCSRFGKTYIVSCEELTRYKKLGLGKNLNLRYWACYKNVNDPKTVQFWIHYVKT